ncbi:MAG: hypothetical protein ABEI86_12065 [Halobacteriaceae archaeon]
MKGVFYIAGGEQFLDEAIQSAKSVREQTDYPISILTDDAAMREEDVFDEVILVSDVDWSWAVKPQYLQEAPYETCVFLDTDTYLADSRGLDDLFDLLDNGVDIAASHGPFNQASLQYDTSVTGVTAPLSLPWFNTGVLAFNQTTKVKELFDTWEDLQAEFNEQIDNVNDQVSFRQAVYEQDIVPHTLPTEYNYRVTFPQVLRNKAFIVHEHATNLAEIEAIVNAGEMPRLRAYNGVRIDDEVAVFQLNEHTVLRRIFRGKEYLKRKGFRRTLERIIELIRQGGTS